MTGVVCIESCEVDTLSIYSSSTNSVGFEVVIPLVIDDIDCTKWEQLFFNADGFWQA